MDKYSTQVNTTPYNYGLNIEEKTPQWSTHRKLYHTDEHRDFNSKRWCFITSGIR